MSRAPVPPKRGDTNAAAGVLSPGFALACALALPPLLPFVGGGPE